MDTKLAIDTLKAMKATVDSNVSGGMAQSDSLALAISQLEGTLQTQIVDAKKAIDTLTGALTDAGIEVPDIAVSLAAAAP